MALFQNQSVHHKSGRNSVVECQLPKLKVVGSNPIARSIFFFTIFNVLNKLEFSKSQIFDQTPIR
jgi:hypothetical protein